jgi:hypothetical protein
MSTECVDIINLRDNDKVLSVEFTHNCNNVLDVSSAEQVHGGLVRRICENRCPRCQKYSGFNCVNEDYDQEEAQKKIDAEERTAGEPPRKLSTERKQSQENLQDLLPRFVAHPTDEGRQLLQMLLNTEHSCLRLRFKISPRPKPD